MNRLLVLLALIAAPFVVIPAFAQPPAPAPTPDPNPCRTQDAIKPTAGDWSGWSIDPRNSRFQPNPGIKAADVPRLKVKWAFAYPGKKNGQVTIIGKRLFVASAAGKVYSLNADTGCVYWRVDATGGVRATPLVARSAKSPSGWALYLADDKMMISARDAMTGKEFWVTKVDPHPRGILTATPLLYKGVLYVPTSSMEETVTSDASYACCTFRGSVVAVNAADGKILWKTFTIPEAPAIHRTVDGKDLLGPAGAAIWSTPTIDEKLGRLYVTTGDSYTDVDTEFTDAVVAMELKTGKLLWHQQVTENDNFIVGCPRTGSTARRPANCPEEVGPDHDFGASALLHTLPNGKRILLAGQKSGILWGLDPDNMGKVVWQTKLGQGSELGGIQWGIAAEGQRVFVAVSDQLAGPLAKWGINAVDPATGKTLWSQPAKTEPCSSNRCLPAHSAALTAIPGVVFSGRLDGKLRAYDSATGAMIWDFDAGKPVDTVNGKKGAVGGAIDATGITIANGMAFQHAGYSSFGQSAAGDNVLFAFTVDGK